MNDQEQLAARDLLRRAGLSGDTISECQNDRDLQIALEVVGDLRGEIPPDEHWFRDWFLITGEHMVLTDEGWIPAEMNTREYTGHDPAEVINEVNAPTAQRSAQRNSAPVSGG